MFPFKEPRPLPGSGMHCWTRIQAHVVQPTSLHIVGHQVHSHASYLQERLWLGKELGRVNTAAEAQAGHPCFGPGLLPPGAHSRFNII